MGKNEVDAITEEKVNKGGVLAKLYFDMQSKNKDELQPLMVDLVNQRLLKEKGVVYCFGSIEEPLERDGVFITSGILTVLTDNFFTLVRIAFSYSPAGVEILKPTRDMAFKPSDLQSMLMQISQISLDYSKYILEKVLKPEDVQKLKGQIDDRIELGKKLLEKKNDPDAK